MKRFIALCVFGCLLSVSAFAQVNLGGYAKTFWIPYRLTVPEEGDPIHSTAVQVPWGDLNISAGINVDGWTEWGGIHLGVGVEGGARDGDSYTATAGGWVWVAPFDFIPLMQSFKLFAGSPVDETLMSRVGASDLVAYVLNGSWDGYHQHRMEYREAHYNIFTRLNPYAWGNADEKRGQYNNYWSIIRSGAMFTWAPIKGLFVGMFVAPEQFWPAWRDDVHANGSAIGPATTSSGDDFFKDYYDAKEVYRTMQFAVGYDMPGIGHARAQYMGMRNTIEAAFEVKFLPDIRLDIGVKIPFEGADREQNGDNGTIDLYKKKKDFQASAGMTYRYADFRLMARIDTAFAGSTSYHVTEPRVRGLDLIAYVVPSLIVEHGTVGLDLGFEFEQKDDINGFDEDGLKAGAAIWFYRNMGNAKFKVAVTTYLPLNWHGTQQSLEVFFPLFLEVGF